VRPIWSKSKRSQSLPALGELIEETRRQRAGPPWDPWTVAYPHALALARDIFWREIKDERRREGVIAEFDARVARIERALEGRDTFGDQLLALDQVFEYADFDGLDLRTRRGRKPHLDPDQVAVVVSSKPSWGACVAIGSRYGLSPDRVHARVRAARRRG